jgi:hypothetical protein
VTRGWRRCALAATAALLLGSALSNAGAAEPATPPGRDPVAQAAAGAELVAAPTPAPSPGGWVTTTTVHAVGRGVAVQGDRRKYREDYPLLESGGGGDAAMSAYDGEGRYLDIAGSILGERNGRILDGGELHVRGGRWGRFSVAGDLLRTEAFYDDSYNDGPLPPGAFPFTDALRRDLMTARTTGRLALQWLVGDRGRVGVTYRHRETEGDRSMIKGSVVESLAPFAFRFPTFQSIDVRSDAVDVDTSVPAGPLTVALTAGYTDERDQTSTNETNFGPTALRDRTRFRDDVHLTLIRAGVDVATPPAWSVFGNAGYRFLFAETDADASQSTGATGSVLVRHGDGISVRDRSHAGHVGFVLSPARDLVVRVAYTLLDRNRDGDGTEVRLIGPGAAAGQGVQDQSTKNVFRQRPRVEVAYAGLPRTLVRARYAYEHSERDFDVRMLGPAVAPLDPVERLERTDEDQNIHVTQLDARVRVTPRLLAGAGYEYRHEEIDEDVRALVFESPLGDRTRQRDTVFANARMRAGRATTLDARGEYQHQRYDRTDIAGHSTTSYEAEVLTLRAVSALSARLVLTGLFSLANRDQNVDIPRARLGTFRSLEFRGRSTTGAVAAVYSLDERTSLQAQCAIVDVGGSFDNVNHRVLASVGRQLTQHVRVAAGYAFLQFDQGLFAGDDFDAHVGWTSVTLTF